MSRPLQRHAVAPLETALAAALGAAAALVPALLLRGFTVDDALIPARYAAHLAAGLGYRFNAAGPVTDGVTPLGFPLLLAPFAGGGPLAALAAAKALGVLAWTIGAAVLAVAVRRAGKAPLRFGVIVLLACSAPLAAWSVAGLETGLAAALGALAVALPELGAPRAGALAGGLVAALRPEALPWALVVGATPPPGTAAASTAVRVARVALAGTPFLVVALTRLSVFGRVIPLSVLAKPSDLGHGGPYALVCFLLTGPVAILAPVAWWRLDAWGRGLVAAVLVHFAAVAAAGGDWMPLSRLVVPALPTALLAAARIADVARPSVVVARLALALAGELFQLLKSGPADVAAVGERRRAIIDAARPLLVGAKVVAALDVGWLGAATDATIVDLAGLTDPDIAVLRGGHTSKDIPTRLLDARGADALVLLVKEGEPVVAPWTDTFFGRIVELKIAAIPGVGDAFAAVGEATAPHLRYLVLRRSP
jgi:hypothetical protein